MRRLMLRQMIQTSSMIWRICRLAQAQPNFFSELVRSEIVNVASVPQRSPFRYPGGKTWLIPQIRQWLRSLPKKPVELIEPFAGGGIVSLTAAFENLASSVTMIERDEQVSAVWETILSDECQWLANQIIDFQVSTEAVLAELGKADVSRKEKAFQTILRNRMSHGGILAPGSGLLRHGENGKGIMSRWYPKTLYKRLLNIAEFKNKIHFFQGDGLTILKENTERSDAVFFIDPPYTAAGKKAGKRLYAYNEVDHQALFKITSDLKGDFLMTYDNAEGVKALARQHGFDTHVISMKNTHHAETKEVLIGRNLSWAKQIVA